ncbi:MAG: 50S ribosomal protein L31e [Methanomassiliicoccales archaeon]|jgi:large subunit ribosomal protein L31e|nr:50S ribosomal protein L31e [Euryarchaeota archaeon]
MADDEKQVVYKIPLRKVKAGPRTDRANRAIIVVREYIMRHMKTDEKHVWIDSKVNELLWARSIENPPMFITVKAVRFEDGLVEVSLPEEQ